jgi:hypothetical protein
MYWAEPIQEANGRSANKNPPSRNLKVHYCVQNNLRMFPIRSHMNPVQTPVSCFFKISYSTMLPSTPMSSNVTSSRCIQFSGRSHTHNITFWCRKNPEASRYTVDVSSSIFGPNILLSSIRQNPQSMFPGGESFLRRVAQPLKKFPAILCISKAHYHIHNSPPLLLILSQTNSLHTFISYFPKIRLNIILPSTPHLPCDLFPSSFLPELSSITRFCLI